MAEARANGKFGTEEVVVEEVVVEVVVVFFLEEGAMQLRCRVVEPRRRMGRGRGRKRGIVTA